MKLKKDSTEFGFYFGLYICFCNEGGGPQILGLGAIRAALN